MRWDPHCVIQVGGVRFDSWRDEAYFKGVAVTLSTGSASECRWEAFDPGMRLIDRWVSGDGLSPLDVKVWLALGPDLGAPVFDGLLAGAGWGDEETASFTFFDRGYLMRRVKETAYHRGLDDVGIIAKLAKENGLGFEGPDPPVRLDKHKSIIQDGQTDWEFIEERAGDSGLVLFVRGTTLYAKEAAKTAATAALMVVYGKDARLLEDSSFEHRAPENQEGRPGKVEVRGRGKGGRRLAGASDENKRGVVHKEVRRDLPIKSKRQADRRAQAKKDLQREHAFSCSLALLTDFLGRRPDVRDTVEVKEAGKLFSGKYLVSEVSHRFGPGELVTEMDLYRDIKAA